MTQEEEYYACKEHGEEEVSSISEEVVSDVSTLQRGEGIGMPKSTIEMGRSVGESHCSPRNPCRRRVTPSRISSSERCDGHYGPYFRGCANGSTRMLRSSSKPKESDQVYGKRGREVVYLPDHHSGYFVQQGFKSGSDCKDDSKWSNSGYSRYKVPRVCYDEQEESGGLCELYSDEEEESGSADMDGSDGSAETIYRSGSDCELDQQECEEESEVQAEAAVDKE